MQCGVTKYLLMSIKSQTHQIQKMSTINFTLPQHAIMSKAQCTSEAGGRVMVEGYWGRLLSLAVLIRLCLHSAALCLSRPE